MKTLLQINPVIRQNTSTARIMKEIGEVAIANGWDSYIAYSKGRDGIRECSSKIIPVGNKLSVGVHGIMTRLFDRHGLHSTLATKQFISEIERIHPDIIHIHNIHGYFLNYKSFFEYLSKSNIPVVWTIHDCWLYTGHCYYYSKAGCDKWKTGCGNCPQMAMFPKSLFIDRSKQNWIDKSKAFGSIPSDKLTIVPVSEWIRGEMSQSFLKNAKYQVIHNGIDLSIFNVKDNNAALERYGLVGKSIILGLASIWSDEKGLSDFIEMSKHVKESEQIVLVGVSQELMDKLPKNIIGIRRTENVHQLAELYSAATAFVNPTWQDNYPTVNLESIACGTPVITYRTGGSIEAVTPDTGFIVEQGDVQGLLSAFREIESRGKDYYQVKCRQFALDHYSKEDRYNEYIELYENIRSR